MAVYVDEPICYVENSLTLCRIAADTKPELVAMLKLLNLKQSFIVDSGKPKERYLASEYRRDLAIEFGAVLISIDEMDSYFYR